MTIWPRVPDKVQAPSLTSDGPVPTGPLSGLHVRHFGEGSRTVHFLHCSLASGKSWAGFADAFRDEIAATAIDFPFHGRSRALGPDEKMHDVSTAAVRSLIKADEGPVDLVGHSFGGTVALRLAAESPELVRSLVLFEPVLFSVLRDVDPDFFAEEEAEDQGFLSRFEAGDTYGAAGCFLQRWGAPGEWDRMPEAQRRVMAERMSVVYRTNPVLHQNTIPALQPDVLSKIAAPVMLVDGAESSPVISAINSYLGGILARSERHTVVGASHMVPLTHTAECAAMTREFWKLETAKKDIQKSV